MKKIFMIAVMLIAVLTFAGCPEDDRPVDRSDVTLRVETMSTTESGGMMATPEPTTLVLLGSGLVALAVFARKRMM